MAVTPACARPFVSFDLKNASNSDRLHKRILARRRVIEDEVRKALAILRGRRHRSLENYIDRRRISGS